MIVGPADDPHERQADLVADLAIGRRSGPLIGVGAATRVQRVTARGAERERTLAATHAGAPRIQRAAVIGPEGGSLDADTERSIAAARTGGTRIARSDAAHLADTVGADVSWIRLHAGPRSAELNDRLQATAFTVGGDVFFRDGIPDTGTAKGMHLLAHEVAHAVQQGGSPIGRRVVRRKLIPKVRDAFRVATNANRDFERGRDATDVYVSEADQEELSRVHGRMHLGQDSPDSLQVAHVVRAVVLKEYGVRLFTLQTATDDSGGALSAAQKAAKAKTYRRKAEEWRMKNVALVAKGSQAPETKAFIAQYGLAAAFPPTANVPAARPGVARIDVRASMTGAGALGLTMRSHLFIVYTTKEGRQMFFRGGPDANGTFTVASMGAYTPDTCDWDPSAPSVTLLEGPAAEAKLDALHRGLTEASALVSSAGENCNAVAWTILTRAGVPTRKPPGHHPGWGSILGSKTAGKQHALPPVELSAAGKRYVVDPSRDLVDGSGRVQVFRDRALFDPLRTITRDDTVQVLAESERWRYIRHEGIVGYIPRRTEDARYDSLPRWVRELRRWRTDEQLRAIALNRNDLELNHLSAQSKVPIEHLEEALAVATHPDGTTAVLIARRIELLGEGRVREILTEPDELIRLAINLHTTPAELVDVAETVVGRAEEVAFRNEVVACLHRHLGDNAPNLAMNEAPDYPTLKAVATEVRVPFDTLVPTVEQLQPVENRGHRLERLLGEDEYAQADLPDVPNYLLTNWANRTGVTVAYLQARCAKIHESGVFSKERRLAEAKASADAAAASALDALTANVAKAREAKRDNAATDVGQPRPKRKKRTGRTNEPTRKPRTGKSKKRATEQQSFIDSPLALAIYDELDKAYADNEEVWTIANDVPDLSEMKSVASKLGARLEDVLLVVEKLFTYHDGSSWLEECFATMDVDVLLALASTGATNPDRTGGLAALCKATGLTADFIRDRIRPWTFERHGRMV